MTTTEYLCRHFSRVGARLKLERPRARDWRSLIINVSRDRSGEYFDVRCAGGTIPEVLDVRPDSRHIVLMVRDGGAKNKYLLGRDEGHWFAAAVPGDGVRDVRTAIESLRPTEIEGKRAVRQGEWFFVPARDVKEDVRAIHFNEPLSRGAGSKPHICEQMMRRNGVAVMVSRSYPTGLEKKAYEKLLESSEKARRMSWQAMVRDAEVYVRGSVRHKDHRTIHLDGWHRVYMNRERFAAHARQIAFLD
jgi:hypothetical protein